VVKVICHRAATSACANRSIVFHRRRQCAPNAHGSSGLNEFAAQTTSRSVQPFYRYAQLTERQTTVRETCVATCRVCAVHAMQAETSVKLEVITACMRCSASPVLTAMGLSPGNGKYRPPPTKSAPLNRSPKGLSYRWLRRPVGDPEFGANQSTGAYEQNKWNMTRILRCTLKVRRTTFVASGVMEDWNTGSQATIRGPNTDDGFHDVRTSCSTENNFRRRATSTVSALLWVSLHHWH